jgi:putative NADH-flavin reductase
LKILIVGATGATGKLLVNQLLENGHEVKAFARNEKKFSNETINHNNLEIITNTVLDISEEELEKHTKECDAIVSTLGHNLSFKGMFGNPKQLVTDSIKKLCKVSENTKNKPVKIILMNTVGCKNEDLKEKVSFFENCVFFLLRYLIPPHSDNENAANYLRTLIGQNHSNIEWVAVRPDSLINEEETSPYTTHSSPIHTLFKPGKTSRINVAHFISELISNKEIWFEWKGKMPVIYNKED